MRRRSRRNVIAEAVLSGRKGPEGKPLFEKTVLRKMSGRKLYRLFTSTLIDDEKVGVRVLIQGWATKKQRFDLNALNHGRKGIVEIINEVRDGEAKLYLDPQTRQVKRFAISLKIFIFVSDYWLCQTMRRYRNGDEVLKCEDFAVTETLMKNEAQLTAAIRGLLQELKLENIEAKDFDLASYFNQVWDVHPSKAYAGIESHVLVYEVLLSFPTRPLEIENDVEFEDGGVTIRLEWRKSETSLVDRWHFIKNAPWRKRSPITEGLKDLIPSRFFDLM